MRVSSSTRKNSSRSTAKTYRVRYTSVAADQLGLIDASVRPVVLKRARSLRTEPEARGKPLTRPLQGLYSMRVRRRWRIVYRIRGDSVQIVGVGIRREGSAGDIYAVLAALAERG